MFGIERPDDVLHRLDQLQRVAARPQQQHHARDRMLGERHVDEVDRPVERVLVLDRLRDTDDLDRRAVRPSEPEALADRVGVRPVVLREVLVDDRDPRRVRGIGGPEAAAAQNRHPHRLEESVVDGVHRSTMKLSRSRGI